MCGVESAIVCVVVCLIVCVIVESMVAYSQLHQLEVNTLVLISMVVSTAFSMAACSAAAAAAAERVLVAAIRQLKVCAEHC